MRRIVALGGSGLLGRTRDAELDHWLLALGGKRKPKVCFIPTASGDSALYVARVERTIRRYGGVPSTLPLFATRTENFDRHFRSHDLIFVGGGNTRNMLALWRLWGVDAALRSAYERGIPIAGVSAGAICWFRAGLTDSFPKRYATMRALGWLRGSFCPHYDSEPRRRPVYRCLIRAGVMPGGYAVDDGVALSFRDETLERVLSARKRASAFFLRAVRGKLSESSLEVDRLT